MGLRARLKAVKKKKAEEGPLTKKDVEDYWKNYRKFKGKTAEMLIQGLDEMLAGVEVPEEVTEPEAPPEKPKKPKKLELTKLKVKDITGLKTADLKKIIDDMSLYGQIPDKVRPHVLEEAEKRGLFEKVEPEVVVEEVEVELEEPEILPEPIKGEYTYQSLLVDKKPNYMKFQGMMQQMFGLNPKKDYDNEAIQVLWKYVQKNKVLPKFEDIPQDLYVEKTLLTKEQLPEEKDKARRQKLFELCKEYKRPCAKRMTNKQLEKKLMVREDRLRNILPRMYMQNLYRRHEDAIKYLKAAEEYKSIGEITGPLWQEFGREWKLVPEARLGEKEIEYAYELTRPEWKEKFIAGLRAPPYELTHREAADLWREYGQYGEEIDEIPLEKIPISDIRIRQAIEEGKPADIAHTVLTVHKLTKKPLSKLDFYLIAKGDNELAEQAEQEYSDLSMKQREEEIRDRFKTLLANENMKDKLEYIAAMSAKPKLDPKLGLNLLAPYMDDLMYKHKESPWLMLQEASTILQQEIGIAETEEEFEERKELEEVTNPEKVRAMFDLELRRVKPTEADIKSIEDKDITRYLNMHNALRRLPSPYELYVRYPEYSKEKVMALANMMEAKYGALDLFREIYDEAEQETKLKDFMRRQGATKISEVDRDAMAQEVLLHGFTEKELEKLAGRTYRWIKEYKPGEDKAKLYHNLRILNNILRVYEVDTGETEMEVAGETISLEDVYDPLMGENKPLNEALAQAKGVWDVDWITEKDRKEIAKYIKQNKTMPKLEALIGLFKDPAKARAIERAIADGKVRIKLDPSIIKEMAKQVGLTKKKELEAAVKAYKTQGKLPVSAHRAEIERRKVEREDAIEQLSAILAVATDDPAIDRILNLIAYNPNQLDIAEELLKHREEIDTEIAKTEERIEQAKRKLENLKHPKKGTRRPAGYKDKIKQIEGGIKTQTELLNQLESNRMAAGAEVFKFINRPAPPYTEFTEGQAKIIERMSPRKELDESIIYGRMVEVLQPDGTWQKVPVSLKDVMKYWVEPIEEEAVRFKKAHGRVPKRYIETMDMEPTIAEMLAEEEKTGKPHPDHDKIVATITFMKYAQETGRYPFEYDLAELSEKLGIEYPPLVSYPPAGDTWDRAARFENWLEWALKKPEIMAWKPLTLKQFIGDDYDKCGYTHKAFTQTGKTDKLTRCAIEKARAIQSQAIVETEPKVILPVVIEAAEGVPIEGLGALKDEIETLRGKVIEELEGRLEERLKVDKLEKQVAKKEAAKPADVKKLEAKIRSGLEEQLEVTEELETVQKKLAKAQAKIKERDAEIKALAKGIEAAPTPVKKKLKKELDRAKKARATAEADLDEIALVEGVSQDILQELKAYEAVGAMAGRLKEVYEKVAKAKETGRNMCFLADEWSQIKQSVFEKAITNRKKLLEIAELEEEGFLPDKKKRTELEKESEGLLELEDYIKELETKDAGKVLCTSGEMKALRGMTASDIKGELADRDEDWMKP